MTPCRHKRTGIVTNQPGTYDRNRAHAAVIVCDRDECITKAKKWAAGETNETAYYVPDADRSLRL